MAQIYSGFYIRSHSRSLPKRPCTMSCIMWSHDTTTIFDAQAGLCTVTSNSKICVQILQRALSGISDQRAPPPIEI